MYVPCTLYLSQQNVFLKFGAFYSITLTDVIERTYLLMFFVILWSLFVTLQQINVKWRYVSRYSIFMNYKNITYKIKTHFIAYIERSKQRKCKLCFEYQLGIEIYSATEFRVKRASRFSQYFVAIFSQSQKIQYLCITCILSNKQYRVAL